MNASKHTLIISVGLSITLVAVLTMGHGTLGLCALDAQQPDESAEVEQAEHDDKVGESDNEEECGCRPDNTSDGVFKTPIEYTKLIEPELGVPPVVDCGAGVEIPIYIDGVKTKGNPGLHCCDNPSLQVGDCMSGSSLQRYEGRTAYGKRLPHVVWVSYCRHEGRPGSES